MTLQDYLQTLKKYSLVILALMVLGGAVGYFNAKSQEPMYRSTSSVLLSTANGETTSELVQGSNYVLGIVQTYALLAESDLVLEPVVEKLDLPLTTQALGRLVSADSPLNTAIIEISVIDASPNVAQSINFAVTESLAAAVSQVSPHDSSNMPSMRLTNINSATLPKVQFSPNATISSALGIGLGFLLGIAFAFVRRVLSTRIMDADDLTGLISFPLLGEIPKVKGRRTLVTSIRVSRHGAVAESFRHLAANLQFASVDKRLRTLVVTSASSGEGKSSISVGLSLALAESGLRVLLIDADLRHPSVARQTQLVAEVGLTSVLLGDIDLNDAAQNWVHENLSVLTSGSVAPNPAQLVASASMEAMVTEAGRAYDIVVIDSAPVGVVTDALWLGNRADGVLFTVRARKSRYRNVRKAVSDIQAANATLIGLVINDIRLADQNSRYYTTDRESMGADRRATATIRG